MKVFAVCGPSGAGKDTLIDGARAARPDLHIVRRTVTRPSGPGEDVIGVTQDEFDAIRDAGRFALDWQAHGLSYGIPISALKAAQEGQTVIFNASRAMLNHASGVFPGLRVINVTASARVLAQRLAGRGRETEADIAARLARDIPLPAGLRVATIRNDGTAEDGIAAFLAALQPVNA